MPGLSSLVDFMNVKGVDPVSRYRPFADWLVERRQEKTWPYRRILGTQVLDRVTTIDENRQLLAENNINYASQDYLGLVQDSRISEAAIDAVCRYGVHSSGSPALLGRSQPMLNLADKLSTVANRECCLLYPTGWAAGYGVIAGLVRRRDIILIDELAHNCLQAGAQASKNVQRFPHNDADAVEQLLREIRADSADSCFLKAAEIVFSDEGQNLRERLLDNVLSLREAMNEEGFEVGGGPYLVYPGGFSAVIKKKGRWATSTRGEIVVASSAISLHF